ELLLALRDPAEVRAEHRGPRVVRLQLRRGQLRVHSRRGRTTAGAVAAAERLQQAATAARRRPAPADAETGGDLLAPERAVPGLRFRVRPQRRQRNRSAELTGSRVCLPSVHGELVPVRRAVPVLVTRTPVMSVEAPC